MLRRCLWPRAGGRPGVLRQVVPRHVRAVDWTATPRTGGGRSAARGHAAPPPSGAPPGPRRRCGPHLRADSICKSLGKSFWGCFSGMEGAATWCAGTRTFAPVQLCRRQQRFVRGHDAFGGSSGGAAAYPAPQGPSHRVVFRPGLRSRIRSYYRSLPPIGGAVPDRSTAYARASVSVLARLVGIGFGESITRFDTVLTRGLRTADGASAARWRSAPCGRSVATIWGDGSP